MPSTVNFLRVEAFDTFAYDHMVFEFAGGIHSIVGNNGEGKSSLFLTLCQGLYNKNPKGGKIDDINNTVTGRASEIHVTFTRDGNTFTVVNSRKLGNIQVFKNGGTQSIAPKGIAPSLKLVEDLLGVSYETFVELTYRNSHSTLALVEENGDAARKAFVGKILRFGELDGLLEKAKGRARDLEKDIQSLSRQRQTLQDSRVELKLVQPLQDTAELERAIEQHGARLFDLYTQKNDLDDRQRSLADQVDQASRAEQARERITAIEAGLGRFTSPYATAEEAREQELHHAVRLADLEAELRHANQQKNLTRHRNELILELEKLQPVRYTTLGEATRAYETWSLEAAQARASYQAAGDELAALQNEKPCEVCPTCGQGLDVAQAKAVYEERRAALEAVLAEAGPKLSRAEAEGSVAGKDKNTLTLRKARQHELGVVRSQLDEKVNDPDVLRKAVDITQALLKEASSEAKKHQRKQELELELAELKQTVPQNLPELEELVQQQRDLLPLYAELERKTKSEEISQKEYKTLLTKTQEHNTIQSTVERFNRDAEQHNRNVAEKLEVLAQELHQAEANLELATSWVKVLGRQGYRLHRMQRFLELLNLTMQRQAQLISNGRIHCRFYLDDDGKIAFSVTDADKSIPYSLWSDGEKARVNLACLFAVLEILEVVCGVGFNLLFLDEVFASLDEAGRDGLFRVLEQLKGQGKSLYTIAHAPIANAVVFDSTIRAVKRNGLAQLETVQLT